MKATVVVEKSVSGEVIAMERRQLIVWHCLGCGVLYALDQEYITERKQDGKSFYCPNGCSRSYRETEEDRLRAQLDRERKQLEWERDALARVRGELATESRRARAYKGEVTKLQNRAHNGVCAFCHRHFVNVERHVKSKHAGPEAAATQAAVAQAER